MNFENTPSQASSIKGLRIVCRGCGVEIMLPVIARDAPANCFNCNTCFADGGGIQSALLELKWLYDTVKTEPSPFS